MRVLFIVDYLPYPLISGDRIRNYNLVRRVARSHEVSLVGFLENPSDACGVAHLRQFCGEVCAVPVRERHPLLHMPGLIRYGLARRPLELKFQYSAELYRIVSRLLATNEYDLVQIEHSRMALYLEAKPSRSRVRCLLDFHNVAFSQYDRIARIEAGPVRRLRAALNGRMMRSWEPAYAENFDGCIAVSAEDRCQLITANPRLNVEIIPNGVDTSLYRPVGSADTPPSLLLIGNMGYLPCADAAIWFCNDILPIIRRAMGAIEVWIVGRDPIPEVTRLAGDGVHVTGRVEDVLPYYERSMVSVVPVRAGGGTRLKILEGMAFGRPIVATRIGSEGLEVIDGKHLLLADGPEPFAEQTLRLLTNKELRERIVIEARELVVRKYDWDAIARKMLALYTELAG